MGRSVVVLHGGPGAPGSAAALARALADPLRVLEPWQRWSSEVPLSVARHVADLAEVLERETPDERPALVGVSWGAMLALVFAARHPERVAALLLVGCGTFEKRARARLQQTLAERATPELVASLSRLERELPDEAERMAEAQRLCDGLYTHCRAADAPDPIEPVDPQGQRESWADMLRLQASGELPEAFAAIDCPVRMLHGAEDPHPGAMTRDALAAHVRQLEYRELERCGHSPWVEEHARESFLEDARGWLARVLGQA